MKTPFALRKRAYPPAWLMGLADLTIGLYVGMLVVTFPELLAARHVPEGTIATLTAAVAFSPSFWAFLVCPVLDIRFRHRTYAIFGAVGCAACFVAALFSLHHLVLLGALLLLGTFSGVFMANALGGWFSRVVAPRDKTTLSASITVANFVGNGIGAVVSGTLIAHLGKDAAAPILGIMLLLPMTVYPFVPATRPEVRVLGASFRKFFRDLLRPFKQRSVWLALVLFVTPTGAFALTNVLGGLGDGFHASAHMVSISSGIGMPLGGIAGSVIMWFLARRAPLRPLYLGVGIVGGLFTLGLLLMPHIPQTFIVAVVGENVFEALALTATFAIIFDTIGQDNPLSATLYSVLGAASTFPVAYMAAIDGHAYQWRGLTGAFGVDGLATIGACLVLSLILVWQLPKVRARSEAS